MFLFRLHEHWLEGLKTQIPGPFPQFPVQQIREGRPGNLHFDKLQVMLSFGPHSEQQVLKSLFTFPLHPVACEGTLLPPTSSPRLGAIKVCAA